MERIILRVYKNKKSGQKLITIPKKINEINEKDFVEVKKVKIEIEK